jgi:hypothetical protein
MLCTTHIVIERFDSMNSRSRPLRPSTNGCSKDVMASAGSGTLEVGSGFAEMAVAAGESDIRNCRRGSSCVAMIEVSRERN